MDEVEAPKKKGRGFASMDPERRRALARLGGVAAQEKGNAHRWNSQEAKEAGKRGGARAALARKS